MEVEITDSGALSSISPARLRSYLQARDWRDEGRWLNRPAAAFSKWSGEEKREIIVSDTESAGDYASIMLESLRVLAEVESRSQLAVFHDLKNPGLDVMRARPFSGLRDEPPFHRVCIGGADLEKVSVVLDAALQLGLQNSDRWVTDDSQFAAGTVLSWFRRLSPDESTLRSSSRLLKREIALSGLSPDSPLDFWESGLRCPRVYETVKKASENAAAMLKARASANTVAGVIEADPTVWAPPRNNWIAGSWDVEGNERSGDSLSAAKTTAVGWAFKINPSMETGETLLWLMAHLASGESGESIRREDSANVVSEWEKEGGRTALEVASLFRGAEAWLSPRP